MSNYLRITPATLPNLSPVINDPQDTELANKLAQVDLQTRRFIYDFLITVFDNSSHLLATALPAATLNGLVSGSTSNTGTQQQIVQGTVSTPDLRDLAVATGKLADQAVTAAKITNANVGTTQLADGGVTSAKIANGAIGSTQLASPAVATANITDGNVTTAKLADGAVTGAKIGANVVGASQLALGSAAGQLLVSGLTPFQFSPVTVTGDISIDNTGKTTLVSQGIVVVQEQAALNTAGGAGTATTWNPRGSTIVWTKTVDTLASSFLTTPVDQKLTLAAGVYLVEGYAPAYEVDGHQTRINHFNAANASLEKFYGSSEKAPAATAVTNRSIVKCKVTIAAGDYLVLEHYIVTHTGSNDFGLPVNATGGLFEEYAYVRIKKVG